MERSEAIRALVTQGVLEVRRGRGTFVSARVEEIEDFGFGALEGVRGQLRDLFELRSMFEPRCAALACRRAWGRVWGLRRIITSNRPSSNCTAFCSGTAMPPM